MQTEKVIVLYKQACRREQALENRIEWLNGWPVSLSTFRLWNNAIRRKSRLGAILTRRRVNPWTGSAAFT